MSTSAHDELLPSLPETTPNPSSNRIHVFETVFIHRNTIGSTAKTETAGDAIPDKTTSDSPSETEPTSIDNSETALTDGHPGKLLTGHDNDPLRPNTDQINYTFLRGEKIWRTFLTQAASPPAGWMREGCMAPYTLLQNMPPLPQDLPRQRSIMGQALWHVPHPELPKSSGKRRKKRKTAWDPEEVYNSQKEFSLAVKKALVCRLCSTRCVSGQAPNSMAILTLCWAYMFNVRFLEMQKRPIQYSLTRLTPVLSSSFKAQPGDIVIYLRFASRQLIRWLCALLAPGLGWTVKGPLPPWTAHFDETTRFVIATDVYFNFLDDERPPSSSNATDLLIEFCRLYDIGSQAACTESLSESLPQLTTGFLAALALPFYNELKLQPQLPVPRLIPSLHMYPVPLDYIREYMKDLRYFMTLSISPASVGSVIWSIFWQPGIECNLVSAWFGSILKVIRPLIEAGNTKQLSNLFALRREQVGLLWRAIFELGDLRILDMIVSYLKSHEERSGGSWAEPDIDVAVWTGSPQSFLDEEPSGSYQQLATQVPRSDLLRHRFNFCLGSPDHIRFGWQPFGYVTKNQIEPDLWPALELGRGREYKHWVWWLKGKEDQTLAEIQQGFRHGEAKYVENINNIHYDETEIASPSEAVCSVGLAPSFEATWSTLHFGAREASGDRSLEAILINGIREHPWFAGSRSI